MLFEPLHTLVEVRLELDLVHLIVILAVIEPVQDTIEIVNWSRVGGSGAVLVIRMVMQG